eukprot:CAMPEP_0167791968 /NCGR_PEP_ID=MMETSP0111_2-20121227/12283_1 /TAXON_ID=91324 /ORGANISM="Lotharella globosa, Strain CCCM811" /LENGTH=359 /DNA_ID=CAMNT_0007684801 /DNA_START=12 /DNA_END=1091 /DNA_ORIENTATION=-
MAELPFALAQQVAGPVGGKLGWAIPLTSVEGKDRSGRDSISFKDAVSFWEKFQCLGDSGKSNGKGVGPLSEAATFEQILANWEFRGRAGTNASLEDVVNYAVTRWQKQYVRSRKTQHHKKARNFSAPYPASKTLAVKLKKSNREKMNRQRVNEKFHVLSEAVSSNSTAKMEKSTVLSEAIRIIEALKIENKTLERERNELSLQCQSVSRCLSAGLTQLQRHRQAANAAAAAAANRHSIHDSKNCHLNGAPPPPNPALPIPKIAPSPTQNIRHSRRRSDALQQLLLHQKKEADQFQDMKSTDSFFDDFLHPIITEEEPRESAPMEDIDTFKSLFSNVLEELPRHGIDDTGANGMCFDNMR